MVLQCLFGIDVTEYKLMSGIRGFQISNPPVLETISLLASLDVFVVLHFIDRLRLQIFAQTSIEQLRAKSEKMTGVTFNMTTV